MSWTYEEFCKLMSAYNEAEEKWMPIQKAHELLHSVNEDKIWEQRNAAANALYKYIAELESELKITDELLKEATETIGIDQFITHYNDAISAGKVSVDVKRELTGAEIEELGAQEAERKEFCPNCEAETPCTHEAELFVCDICGEDFAKYFVLRNCTLPDVSMTQDVTTPEPPEVHE